MANPLIRIAEALERLSPPVPSYPDSLQVPGLVWNHSLQQLQPVRNVRAIPLEQLQGIEPQKQALLENTRRFANGLLANNALLWGRRGTGKSSLTLSVFHTLYQQHPTLRIIEIPRDGIADIATIITLLSASIHRFILFCDDLSFTDLSNHYTSLKPVLEGGIAGRPEHIVFYATSNQRSLTPQRMEDTTHVHAQDIADESLSLADRFGLSLGFHYIDQATYLEMIQSYCDYFSLDYSAQRRQDALAYAASRGNRSGRCAWHFMLTQR